MIKLIYSVHLNILVIPLICIISDECFHRCIGLSALVGPYWCCFERFLEIIWPKAPKYSRSTFSTMAYCKAGTFDVLCRLICGD
jgi:hypothetical protein